MTRALAVAVLAAVLIAGPGMRPSEAQLGLSCSVSTTDVAFGSYDVFSPTALESAGAVQFQCTVGILIRLQLTAGSSGTFAPRTLRSGAESLAYNLYLDAPRTVVWGDGGSGTSTYTGLVQALLPVSVPVYGRIPAQQDVAAGPYSDSVVTTIVF